MRILDILYDTTVDGPGFRTSIYFAGCLHHCPGCHNPQSWNMHNGREMSIDEVMSKINAHQFADVTFTGGDPMYQADELIPLAKEIHKLGKTIWCYTGFTFEQCFEDVWMNELLHNIDVLVDGPFIQELKNKDLPFRGSSNQQIVDIPRSLASGKVVEFDLDLDPRFE